MSAGTFITVHGKANQAGLRMAFKGCDSCAAIVVESDDGKHLVIANGDLMEPALEVKTNDQLTVSGRQRRGSFFGEQRVYINADKVKKRA